MHLGTGALTPECAALTTAAAAAGLATAIGYARRESLKTTDGLLTISLGAFVFVAQMVNVPLLPYSSGHLVGGVLLAAVLSPARGVLVMSLILALQAVLLGDGALTALGANILNMALVPAGLVVLSRRWLTSNARDWTGDAATGLCGLVATLGAAGLIVMEVALFRPGMTVASLGTFAQEMLWAHAVIGVAEAAVTCAAAAALRYCRAPKLGEQERRLVHARPALLLAVATLLLLVTVPFSSELPDGYEASAERSGWSHLLGEQ